MAEQQSAVIDEIKKNIEALQLKFEALEKKVQTPLPKEQVRTVLIGPAGAGKGSNVSISDRRGDSSWRVTES